MSAPPRGVAMGVTFDVRQPQVRTGDRPAAPPQQVPNPLQPQQPQPQRSAPGKRGLGELVVQSTEEESFDNVKRARPPPLETEEPPPPPPFSSRAQPPPYGTRDLAWFAQATKSEFDLDGARIFPPIWLESMTEAADVLGAWGEIQALSLNDRNALKAIVAVSRVGGKGFECSPAVREVYDRVSAVLATPERLEQVLGATDRMLLQSLVGFGEMREARRQQRPSRGASDQFAALGAKTEMVETVTGVDSAAAAGDAKPRVAASFFSSHSNEDR
jgi:hypothetical protein